MMEMTRRGRSLLAVTMSIAAIFGSSCTQSGKEPLDQATGGARVAVLTSELSQADIAHITLTVSGSNIPAPITAELIQAPDAGLQWTATVSDIPVGMQRFAATAFGGVDGGVLYQGATDAIVEAGARAQVVILLQETNPASPFTHVAPAIDSLTASRSTVPASGLVDLSVTAHDRNTPPEALTYAWTAVCALGADNGTLSAPTSPSTQWTAPAADGQSCTLSVKVSNVSVSRTMSFLIAVQAPGANGASDVFAFANTFPVIASLRADFSVVGGQTVADLSLEASDPDGDHLRYAWTSSCNGTFDTTAPYDITHPRCTFADGGTDCVITARVFDLCTNGNCGAVMPKRYASACSSHSPLFSQNMQ